MKFCSIFFDALAYNSAYSCLLRKIMHKTCFKGKFMGEISVLRNWKFWVWSLFLGIINEITWSVPELAFSHYLSVIEKGEDMINFIRPKIILSFQMKNPSNILIHPV